MRKWLQEKPWLDILFAATVLIVFAYAVRYYSPPPIAKVRFPSHKCYQVISREHLTCKDYEKNPDHFEVVWVSDRIAPLVSE